jgi:hypothetical protein
MDFSNEQILIGLLLLVILYLLWSKTSEYFDKRTISERATQSLNPSAANFAPSTMNVANTIAEGSTGISYGSANIIINDVIYLKNRINENPTTFKLRPQDVERINAVPPSMVVTDFNNRLAQIIVPADDVQRSFYASKISMQRALDNIVRFRQFKGIINVLPITRIDPGTKYRLYSALYTIMLINYLQVQNVLNLNPAPVIVARPK